MRSLLPQPVRLWWWSTRLHARGVPALPRLLKLLNFVLFHAVLPPEARIEPDLRLEHYGLGVVVHPNVTIGYGVKIWHNVTLAAETTVGSPHRLTVEDGVMIGASAQIIARVNESLTLGRGSSIGAGAVVTRSVRAGATVVGVPARVTRRDRDAAS
jgi:serine O-acetyltransferase